MPSKRIEHGDTVQDKITKFKGIATARANYISGCDHILVAPQTGKDGKYVESVWLDEPRLTIVKKGSAIATSVKPKGTLSGG